ncbi:MAG TPA: proton-conducting transporter membrane subunit [Stellaceae bacterium]|nr:proton-conducting transporter membrane subunit [Stellaceae bacterium]
MAPWPMPGGSLHLELDALAAFFLLPVFGLSLAAAIYGRAYLAGPDGKSGAAGCWFHMSLLTIGMALVVVAHDGLLFLLAWEIMALSPFFLVIFDDRKAAVRHAAWTYLAAAHIGTAFLVALFVVLGGVAGNSDFDAYAPALRAHPELCSIAFLLALFGFGSKAGIVPAHVWLPEAHPVAPSHASALMSGAMIKVGIYGLVRLLTMLGIPASWWGWLLIAVGASSGILGVLFALAQHDLKRLLAYHSVENIGIILIGIGAGVLGLATGIVPLAVIGFAAGLLHVLNHSIFKGLLFLGAGAVQRAAHTLDLEELGGLLKRMPWTSASFLIGAAAIVGLPPLNGFVSEFLLFYAGFAAVLQPGAAIAAAGLVSIVVMGLISGLAAACFAKAFGIVFLGAPRSREAADAHEVHRPMIAAMAMLALLCIAIGLAAPLAVAALSPVLAAATGLSPAAVRGQLAIAAGPLAGSIAVFVIAVAAAGLIWLWRRRSLLRAGIRRGPVWGCGYLFPTARMQYTASSFAQPLTTQFRLFVRNREALKPPHGYFPRSASYASDSGDPVLRLLFVPTFRWFDRMAARLNVIQHGHTHIYVLYVAATLVALLIWASL